jgi:competence protein ComEA
MRVRSLYVLLVAVGTAALCSGQVEPRSEAADNADFEKVCGSCHASSMVSDLLSAPEWKETVEQMVSIGAKGTDQQMEAVMRVLLRTFTKVNVNKATAAELPLVLDINEATAQAVVKYRDEHGVFKTLDDLKKVPGVNAAKLDARKDRVVF